MIGSGDSVRIWEDHWILNHPHFRPNLRENAFMGGAIVVSQLLNHSKTQWDISKLRYIFDDAMVTSICQIPLPLNVHPINGYEPNQCLESCLLSQLIGLVEALTLLQTKTC